MRHHIVVPATALHDIRVSMVVQTDWLGNLLAWRSHIFGRGILDHHNFGLLFVLQVLLVGQNGTLGWDVGKIRFFGRFFIAW